MSLSFGGLDARVVHSEGLDTSVETARTSAHATTVARTLLFAASRLVAVLAAKT
jgi:hypothetical protein